VSRDQPGEDTPIDIGTYGVMGHLMLRSGRDPLEGRRSLERDRKSVEQCWALERGGSLPAWCPTLEPSGSLLGATRAAI
jgi:hypothetical protein